MLGASGFVGHTTCRELKSRQYNVTEVFHSEIELKIDQADMNEVHRTVDVDNDGVLRELFGEIQPVILINAVGHPSNIAPSAMREFYHRSTLNVLSAVQKETPQCRVILLGSAAEYGNSPKSGSREQDTPKPLSEYGWAKVLQSELASRFISDGLDIITARLFNPIGPSQDGRAFAGALMKRIRAGEGSLRVDNANYLRDWIDIRDVARALVILGMAADPPPIVNICTGKSVSVGELAAKIATLARVEIKAISTEISPECLWRSVGNPELMQNFDWRPQYTLEQSLLDQWRSLA